MKIHLDQCPDSKCCAWQVTLAEIEKRICKKLRLDKWWWSKWLAEGMVKLCLAWSIYLSCEKGRKHEYTDKKANYRVQKWLIPKSLTNRFFHFKKTLLMSLSLSVFDWWRVFLQLLLPTGTGCRANGKALRSTILKAKSWKYILQE